MFIPVGNLMQFIEQVDKDANGNIEKKQIMAVRVGPTLHFNNGGDLSDLTLVCSFDRSRQTSGRTILTKPVVYYL